MANSMLIVGMRPDGSTIRRTLHGIRYDFQRRIDGWIARGYRQVIGYPSNDSTGKSLPVVRAFADGYKF